MRPATVETLTGSTGNDTVTMVAASVAGMFTTVNLGAGTDVLNVVGNSDISAATVATISNVETGNITGTGGNDTFTVTGAQLDALIIGAGTINMGAGTDTLNLKSTSADLNTLGSTDASIQGLEAISASAAASGVTITLSAQTEGFTLTGSGSADIITAGSGADTLTGGAGADTIDGGGGNDIFNLANNDFAVGSVESLTGGTGNDAIVFTNATTVDFSNGALATIETLTGSSGNDIVTMLATSFAGMFTTIDLAGGTDAIAIGVSGTMDISAATAATVSNVETGSLTGTTGNETITLTGAQLDAILIGSGIINLGAGTDTINLKSTSADLNTLGATDASILGLEIISASAAASGVTITLSGQTEGFTITGGSSADTITGGSGADTIAGGAGADKLDGGSGNDVFNLANGDFASGETITGGAGNDAIVLTNPTTVDFTTGTLATVETLTGATGNDTVTILATQYGGMFTSIDLAAGTDTLIVLASGTVNISAVALPTLANIELGALYGSAGNDTFTVTGAQLDAIIIGSGTINMGAGTDTLNLKSTSADLNTLGATDASIQNLEAISASAAASGVTIDLSGQTEGFTLTGSASADTITGGAGNDAIEGGSGNDTLTGGAGNDMLSYASASAGVTVDISVSTAQNTIGAGTDTVSGFENLTGTAFNDTLIGTTGNNTIIGGDGDDYIFGKDGTDTIDGGAGNDWAKFFWGFGCVIDLNAGTALKKIANTTDTLISIENIDMSISGASTITGNAGANTLIGGTGNDTINGGDGDDFIEGGASTGNDVLIGGNGTDIVSYGYSGVGVTVDLSVTTSQNTGAGTDTLSGFENLSGSGANDTLSGDGGVNVLWGLNGNDVLYGNGGADTLIGGSGSDTFLFKAATYTSGSVTISDMSTGQGDKIDIANVLSGYVPGVSVNTDFVNFTTSGSDTLVSVDANGTVGGSSYTQIATLTGLTLTNADVNTWVTNGNLIMS